MTDLLYVGSKNAEVKKGLKNNFINIKIEETYDDVHEERLLIELEDKYRENYLEYILVTGLSEVSFYLQMAIRTPEKIDEIKTIMEKLKRSS